MSDLRAKGPLGHVIDVFDAAPRHPVMLLVALTLTILAGCIVLAREATDQTRGVSVEALHFPAGVFRSPYPTIVAREVGWPSHR